MLRQVLRELRFHPSRFVATIIAIAISVAFMGGSSVLVATEQNGVERQQSLPIAGADIVVTAAETSPESVREVLATTAGIAAFEPSLVRFYSLRQGVTTSLMTLIGLPSEPLRWSQVEQGRWPERAGEIVLTRGAAASLQVVLGGTVSSGLGAEGTYTVVGLTGEPNSLFLQTGYVAPEQFSGWGVDPKAGDGTWLVRVDEGFAVTDLVGALQARFDGQGVSVESAAGLRAKAVKELAGEFDVFRNLLWAFAAVAGVVGMITIANTFTILLAQRRRQIGLLRAVGASSRQVRRRYFAEALALGAVGSAAGIGLGIGISAVGAAITGSLYWGMQLPAGDLAIAFLAGVVLTVLAAYLPVLRGTRVRPLEALQPEPAADERRRAGRLRAVVCGLLVAAGGVVAFVALGSADQALALAVIAGALITLGVLFGAVLFVPPLLRGVGALVGRLGVTPRLAGQNAVRNPRRAAATATALMLAVGLIVTLQVGTATVSGTVLGEIDRSRPVDIQVGGWDPVEALPADLVGDLLDAPGVAGGALLPAALADFQRGDTRQADLTVLGYVPEIEQVVGAERARPDDTQVLVTEKSADATNGERITLWGRDASLELTVVKSSLVSYGQVMVSAATLAQLGGATADAQLWLSVPDRAQAANAAGAITELVDPDRYQVTGPVIEAAAMESVLGVLLMVTTALLGVAVLIALLGVSNTLGLSVLERARESALMRALGLQARSLRVMLLVEALLLALVGVGVGVAAGVFFGWLGAAAVAVPLEVTSVTLRVDLAQTLGMVAVAVLAAALASVLPGRRAAKASPTEALADI